MKNNWHGIETQQKMLQRKIRNTKNLRIFLDKIKDLQEGEIYDTRTNTIINIHECKDSTLRRLYNLLHTYFTISKLPEERRAVFNKLTEVNKEIELRDNSENTAK